MLANKEKGTDKGPPLRKEIIRTNAVEIKPTHIDIVQALASSNVWNRSTFQ